MAISISTEASGAGNYPANRFGQRERKLIKDLKTYIDAQVAEQQIIASGTFTTVGGDANEAITVTGALSTDIVMVSLKTAGAVPRTVLSAAAAANAVNVVMSGDPDDDHVLQYIVVRAG